MTDTRAADHRGALVRALGVLGRGPEERLDRITRMAQEAFGVPLSFLNLIDEHTVYSQSAQGPFPQGGTAPAQAVFCSTTIEQAEPTIVSDTTLDTRFAGLPVVIDAPHIRFYAGAPLTMIDGTRVGTLCLMDTAPRVIGDEDVQLLRDLARWAERELAQSVDRERLRRVLDGLVPDPVDIPGYDLDSVSIAREEGGGDIVDWRRASNGDLLVTIGDVATSGPAAAILASGLRGALVARSDQPLDAAMLSLEAQVEPELARADTVATVFQARLTPRSGRVDFVDAGHGLALHVRADGTANVLRSLDLPIGLHPSGIPRASGSLVLRPGDRLVLLTDGVLRLDGFADLGAVARAVVESSDGAAFVDRIRSAVLDRRPDADVTTLVLSRA
jgi:hypothetical protein